MSGLKKLTASGKSLSAGPIRRRAGAASVQTIEGSDYETYLYVDQGNLKELIIEKGRA
jgi:hypothetical protein